MSVLRVFRNFGWIGLLGLCWMGCQASGEPPKPDTGERAATRSSAPSLKMEPHRRGPIWMRGPQGEQPIASFVKQQLALANAEGQRVLVYVGAPWCEPCQYFHRAVKAGQYERELSGVRLLEFDADTDQAGLSASGYASQMIPLFAVPDAEGRASSRRIFGSIAGPGAVEELRPRLVELLAQAPE